MAMAFTSNDLYNYESAKKLAASMLSSIDYESSGKFSMSMDPNKYVLSEKKHLDIALKTLEDLEKQKKQVYAKKSSYIISKAKELIHDQDIFYFNNSPDSLNHIEDHLEALFIITETLDKIHEWSNRKGQKISHNIFGLGVIVRISIKNIHSGYVVPVNKPVGVYEIRMEAQFPSVPRWAYEQEKPKVPKEIKVKIITYNKDREFAFDD